jgi:hypothetical protein
MSQINKVATLAACGMLWAPRVGLAGDWVKVKFDPTSRQYCHEVRFPLVWQSNHNENASRYQFDIGSDLMRE